MPASPFKRTRLAEGFVSQSQADLPRSQGPPQREASPGAEIAYEKLTLAVPAVLAALIDSVACGVLLFGAAGKRLSTNDRLAEMLRIERARLDEFTNFEQLVSFLAPRFADSDAVAARWRQRFGRDEASWDELELLRPERRILERFARPVADANGQRLGWLEIYRDVTTQRLIEKKLLHTERMAAIGQMVSGIAHELNNPLTSVLGYAQLLLTHRSSAQRDEHLRHILQQTERASRIAKNLLLMSRESKRERSPVDLNDVVERTLALRSYELRQENIEVILDLEQHLSVTLGDAGQLQQVLLNLVVNAEQAIQQDKAAGHIWLRTRRISEDRIAMEVTDDGPGIAPEPLSHIFDPFFTTKPAGVGTGLGLSIVYGIVHEHGGDVLVDSREGAGATFTVELPAGEHTTAVKSASHVAQAQAAPIPPSRKNHREAILVVEDEPTVARLIADVLMEEGYRVDTVLDSRKGLSMARRKAYGLVICDLRMPHLDGQGFYRELLRHGARPEQRVVFVTGDTLAPRTVEFLESSGVPYLAKPFLVEEFKDVVHRALVAEQPAGASVAAAARPARHRRKGNRHERTGQNEPTIQIVCADLGLLRKYRVELEKRSEPYQFQLALSAAEARRSLHHVEPGVILLDESAAPTDSRRSALESAVARLSEAAPVVVVASARRQPELAFLMASGVVDFVARSGGFVSSAADTIEWRVRLADPAGEALAAEHEAGDFGEILRHEVSNPLTGILGNAELLLARRDLLPPAAIQRVETIAELAMRLRETVRRLSHAWEDRQDPIRPV